MGEKRQFRNSDWAKAALGKASIPQWFENGSSHVEVNDYPNDLREVEIRCASLENFPYDVAFIIAMWEPVGRFFDADWPFHVQFLLRCFLVAKKKHTQNSGLRRPCLVALRGWRYEALMETLQHMNRFTTLTVGKCKNVTHDAGVPQFSGASLVLLEQLGKVLKIVSRFLEVIVIWIFFRIGFGGRIEKEAKEVVLL